MSVLTSYRLRLRRQRYRFRAFRKQRELRSVVDRSKSVQPGAILSFTTLRNEMVRLPWFLDYYRKLGVDHFFFVDNGSTDGGHDYLAGQKDVSLWATDHSYKSARFGVDWLNWLQYRHGHGHWALAVDVDEFLVYPFSDTRSLRALTDWLDASLIKAQFTKRMHGL